MNSQLTFDGLSQPSIFYDTPSISNLSTILTYSILSVALLYFVWGYLDLPVPPLLDLFWNLVVYLTPTSLVAALDRNSDVAKETEIKTYMYLTFTSKSEAMRRIFGLESGGVLNNIQRGRSLTGLGTVFKSVEKASLPGLGNWDNSCYQNSILQGLASLPSLSTFLDTAAQISPATPREAGRSTSRALRDMISDLNNPANGGQRLWTPTVLKSMSSWQQQDAQEYYSKILDQIDKESSRALKEKSRMTGLLQLKNLSIELPEEKHFTASAPSEVVEKGADTQITEQLESSSSMALKNPLEGLLGQRVGCLQCGYVEGLSLIPFNCLTVPLGRQCMYDIRTCLDDYTALERINGVECSKCTLLRHKDQLERLLDRFSGTTESNMMSDTLRISATERLKVVTDAVEADDLSESTILKKCQIPAKNRISTTKSKQAVIARPPTSLVIHINRSVFDEATGIQSKNHADVKFPRQLDLSPWVLGGLSSVDAKEKETESWNINPSESMLPDFDDPEQMEALCTSRPSRTIYTLQAVVTHYGRHENGHYICYRRDPNISDDSTEYTWWRLSDDDVSRVSESEVLAQGGVFMLFYELLKDDSIRVPLFSQGGENLDAVTSHSGGCDENSPIRTVEPELEQQTTTTPPKGDAHTIQDSPLKSIPPSTPSPPSLRPLSTPPAAETPIFTDEANKVEPPVEANLKTQFPTGIESHIDTSISDTLNAPDSRKVAPPMRTAGPRGSGGRGSVKRAGKAMNSVSSMVTAN
ncbi:MAG: hypothetical protein MMC33_010848 [Icmadophila ericetorum]|nr:hypothetical protein [Icmadophila ericetorum]